MATTPLQPPPPLPQQQFLQQQQLQQKALTRVGERSFERIERTNAEMLTMTYGALVTQMLRDQQDDCAAVNKLLDSLGYRIGVRLVDEFLAKSGAPACRSFVDSAEVIAKVGLKMFLGVTATVSGWSEGHTSYSLVLEENPLNTFVELPERHQKGKLLFSNVLCGVIRGAMEMVMYKVECAFVKDVLRGDDTTEIRVTLIETLKESFETGED
eukprot:RCo033674